MRESSELLAEAIVLTEIRNRVDHQRRQLGPRPPWWRPFARQRWEESIAGVEASVLRAMIEDALAEVRTEHPYRQLVHEVPRRPWSKPRCMAVGEAVYHVREVGKPGCQCGFEDPRPAPTGLPGPGERQSR